jgi:hypothetical protein
VEYVFGGPVRPKGEKMRPYFELPSKVGVYTILAVGSLDVPHPVASAKFWAIDDAHPRHWW